MKEGDTGPVPILLLVLPIPACSILAVLPGTLPAELHPHLGW